MSTKTMLAAAVASVALIGSAYADSASITGSCVRAGAHGGIAALHVKCAPGQWYGISNDGTHGAEMLMALLNGQFNFRFTGRLLDCNAAVCDGQTLVPEIAGISDPFTAP